MTPDQLDAFLEGQPWGSPAPSIRDCTAADPCERAACERCGDADHIDDERDDPREGECP